VRVESKFRRKVLRRYTRMKNADWLDVEAAPWVDGLELPKNESYESASELRVHTQGSQYWQVWTFLSEQHSSHAEVKPAGLQSNPRSKCRYFGVPDVDWWRISMICKLPLLDVHEHPRILKFLPTIEADLVRPLLDGKRTTKMIVMAAKSELENSKQGFHSGSARLRSKLRLDGQERIS
jgi:hypothetical protein